MGDDPGSAIYVTNKIKACAEVGIESYAHRPPADGRQDEVHATARRLGADEKVAGILLQLADAEADRRLHLTTLIDPDKDVDGLTPVSAGGRKGHAGPASVHARRA